MQVVIRVQLDGWFSVLPSFPLPFDRASTLHFLAAVLMLLSNAYLSTGWTRVILYLSFIMTIFSTVPQQCVFIRVCVTCHRMSIATFVSSGLLLLAASKGWNKLCGIFFILEGCTLGFSLYFLFEYNLESPSNTHSERW